jgi:hypothetical protein
MEQYLITTELTLGYDSYLGRIRQQFEKIVDNRAKNVVHNLPDVLMSGLAMFILKHPSIHRFEQQTPQEKANLHSLFGIKKLCTDAQMRNILDNVSPDDLRPFFLDYYGQLKEKGVIDTYRYYDNSLIVAIDGVSHFESTSIHCPNCQCTKRKDGVHYSHAMLAASIVCPGQAEVFPLCLEPIVKQDGIEKNDCERNACSRLMSELKQKYAQERFIFTGDALFANAPHINRILNNSDNLWHFVLNIKPDSHKTLFNAFESRRTNKALGFMEKREKGEIHRFYWANNLPLGETVGGIRVNMLWYEWTDKKGKTTRFTWCTDYLLDKKNVLQIMKIGRCRWKIENETFNTLKNQGYHFEHNYGHGYQHLATTLAFLMFMAFAVDQLMQKTASLFIKVWESAKTKKRLWEALRAVNMTLYLKSFKHLYIVLAQLFEVQLE